jgi:hypothetical protein
MSTSRVLFTVLALGTGGAFAAQAEPISLNVRPGLWEMTTTGQATGAPPIPADLLASMPPDRRAKFEAAMAATMARSAAAHTYKQCVTAENLAQGFDLNEKSKGMHECKPVVVSSTASVMEVREECTGRENVSGTFRFEAASPETMNGTIDMAMSDGVHTMNIKRVIHAKWLGADCGNVKSAGD